MGEIMDQRGEGGRRGWGNSHRMDDYKERDEESLIKVTTEER